MSLYLPGGVRATADGTAALGITLELLNVTAGPGMPNRVSIGFDARGPTEGYYGFGERFNTANQRGQQLYTWVEDGGFSLDMPVRLPKGPTSTYMPMPWFYAAMPAARTLGVWVNTSCRTDWDLSTGNGLSSQQLSAGDVAHDDVQGITRMLQAGQTARALAHARAASIGRTVTPAQVDIDVGQARALAAEAVADEVDPGTGWRVWTESTRMDMVLLAGASPAAVLRSFTSARFQIQPGAPASIEELMAPMAGSEYSQPQPGVGRGLIPPPYAFHIWNQFGSEFNWTSNVTIAAQRFVAEDMPTSVAEDPLHWFPDGTSLDEAALTARNARLIAQGVLGNEYFNSMVSNAYKSAFAQAQDEGLFVHWRPGWNVSNAAAYIARALRTSSPVLRGVRAQASAEVLRALQGQNVSCLIPGENNASVPVNADVYAFCYKGAGSIPFAVALLDFTKPAASTWWQGWVKQLVQTGATGFMQDYGEYVDPNTVTSTGVPGTEAHNLYPLPYQASTWSYLTTSPAQGGPPNGGIASQVPAGASHPYYYAPPYLYYVRSGYVGMGSTTWAAWTGDPSVDWTPYAGLPAQLKAMLTLGLSGGPPVIGSDVPGFVWLQSASDELVARWTQLGSVSGNMHTDTGGTSMLGEPKTVPQSNPVLAANWRKHAKLRTALWSYLYTALHEYQDSGMPLLRHHLLQFPNDAAALASGIADSQFCLGPSFLIAPVFSENATQQQVYLPKDDRALPWYAFSEASVYDAADGRWRVGAGAAYAPGTTATVAAPLDMLPMFVRAGTALSTVDPGVHTFAHESSPPAAPQRGVSPPSYGAATTYSQLANVTHGWAFLQPMGSSGPGASLAAGSSWDGWALSISADSASTFTVQLTEPVAPARTSVLQIAGIPAGHCVSNVTAEAHALPHAPSWPTLLPSSAPAAPGADGMWASPTTDIPGTMWLRITPATTVWRAQVQLAAC